MAEIILRNPQKFDVGVFTSAKDEMDHLGVNIPHGSFLPVTETELKYIASRSNVLRRGILRVEDDDEAMRKVGIDQATDPNFISDEEIAKKLGGTVKKIKEWLGTVNEGYILDRIYDVAMTMNLSMDKLKVLQAKMPDKNILGE